MVRKKIIMKNISIFFRRLFRNIFKFLNSFQILKAIMNKKPTHLMVGERICNEMRTIYGPGISNRLVLDHMKKMWKSEHLNDLIPDLNADSNAVIKILFSSMEFQEECVPGGPNYVPIICGSLLGEARKLLDIGFTYKEIINSYKIALTKSDEVCQQFVHELGSGKKNKETVHATSNNDLNLKIINNVSCLPVEKDEMLNMIPKDESKVLKTANSPVNIIVYASSFCQDAFINDWSEEYINDLHEVDTDLEVKLVKLLAEVRIIDNLNVSVIVSYGKFDDHAVTIMKEYDIIGVNISDKMDLYRICRMINTSAMKSVSESYPFDNVIGTAEDVTVENGLAIFKVKSIKKGCNIIVFKENTDDFDRYRNGNNNNNNNNNTKENKLQKDGGSVEIKIGRELLSFAKECQGIYRDGVEKFAYALEIIPKTLGEFLGLNTDDLLARLHEYHEEGGKYFGVFPPEPKFFQQPEGNPVLVLDLAVEDCLLDEKSSDYVQVINYKRNALKNSVNTVCEILELDFGKSVPMKK